MIQKANCYINIILQLVVNIRFQDLLFTSITEFFSSFLHSTISLLVIQRYLEFEEWFSNIQKDLHIFFSTNFKNFKDLQDYHLF